MAVRAGVLPLGQVPYDNLSLPVVSPDGQFIATQTGLSPTWPTVLAAPDAPAPEMTRIEIYRLDRRSAIKDEKDRLPPALAATLKVPALLGRSCDSDGFLIEVPREDGSRWIGKAAWSSSEIEWLVNDGHINAFASLGPDGRLTWSRRKRAEVSDQMSEVSGAESPTSDLRPLTSSPGRFELVIRNAAGEWILPSLDDDDWLLPTWSGRGDWLFVMRLRDKELEAVFANTASAAAFRQSLQTFGIASESTIFTAYQSLSSVVNIADDSGSSAYSGAAGSGGRGGAAAMLDQLVYFHPALNRAAFWRPLGRTNGGRKKSMFLNPNSLTAVLDEEDLAIVATDKQLIRQRLSDYNQRINLLAGTLIPRPTPDSDWPYVLLAPLEGRIGVTAMRLLPIDARTPMGEVQRD